MNTYHTIIQGEDRDLKFRVSDENGGSFDITAASEITASLKNADLTILELTKTGGGVTISDGPAGKFYITISELESAALPASSKPASITVEFVIAGRSRIVNFLDSILIEKKAVS